MSDPSTYVPLWPAGAVVRVVETDPTDHIRGIRDGAVGVVVAPDRGKMIKRGKKWERDVIRCPQVGFQNGETVWMAMHQLRAAA